MSGINPQDLIQKQLKTKDRLGTTIFCCFLRQKWKALKMHYCNTSDESRNMEQLRTYKAVVS